MEHPPRDRPPLEYGKFTRVQLVRAWRKRKNWLEARCAIRQEKGEDTFFDEMELAMLKWLAEKAQINVD